jgi:hypothetical protein
MEEDTPLAADSQQRTNPIVKTRLRQNAMPAPGARVSGVIIHAETASPRESNH